MRPSILSLKAPKTAEKEGGALSETEMKFLALLAVYHHFGSNLEFLPATEMRPLRGN